MGITKTRAIFEKAIHILENNDKIDMGQRFALLERKLGEIDRARVNYIFIRPFINILVSSQILKMIRNNSGKLGKILKLNMEMWILIRIS